MSKSLAYKKLKTEDLDRLLKWYEESYEDGWRPQFHVVQREAEFYDRVVELIEEGRH